MYKKDCNTCHCVKGHLICTKMACLPKAVMQKMKLKSKLNEFPKTNCVPGKFYRKGCKKCFCQVNGKPLCSETRNCKDANNKPTSPAALRQYSAEEFHLLPSLPHEAAACEAGATYRVDCNTCLCLADGNLMCERLLCPSFDDVNRLNAKDMSGGPCTKANISSVACIECKCMENVLQCKPEPGCVSPETRRVLHGGLPENSTRIHLDPKKGECMEGMVYKTNCNKCYCQKDKTVRCTQKTCLNHVQVERMKKLRLKLEKNVTDNNPQYQLFPVTSGTLRFKVHAPNNAHIALTTGPNELKPMYEILIGCFVNTVSMIRKNKVINAKVKVNTPWILDSKQFNGFWVRWDNGEISAGREGEAKPFMSWTDPEPFLIAYFGVCTRRGASGTWRIEDVPEFVTENNWEYKFFPAVSGSLEFMLGGWDRFDTSDKTAVAKATDFRKFLLEWHRGRLVVRDALGGAELMEWRAKDPFPVTHFGVRTRWGS